MRQYELTVIYPLEDDQQKAGREQLLADLTAQNAEIVKTDENGDRDLTYPIKKRTRAKYVLYTLNLEPTKLAGLDRTFRLNQNILKFLFVRVEE